MSQVTDLQGAVDTPEVVLLVGPAGSGKTTLAACIADNPGWHFLSEDDTWNEIGHPSREPRDDDGQDRVHACVHRRIEAARNQGLRVVLEFLVYENPPRRLFGYQTYLTQAGISFATRVLRPSVETILARQPARGRPTETDMGRQRGRAGTRYPACARNRSDQSGWSIPRVRPRPRPMRTTSEISSRQSGAADVPED